MWGMGMGLALAFGWLVNHMFTVWMAQRAPKNGDYALLDVAVRDVQGEVMRVSKELEDLNGRINGISLRMGIK